MARRVVFMLVVFVPILFVASCSRSERKFEKRNFVAKHQILKSHPVLQSRAQSFDDLFEVTEEIQLETKLENPIGTMPVFAIGPGKEILVVDRISTRKVYLFDSTGRFLTTVGMRGRGPGEYEAPEAPAFDSGGNIYVYDLVRLVLNKYSADGTFLRDFQIKKYARKLTVDEEGNLFFFTSARAERENDVTVFKYDSEGNLRGSFAPFPESYVEGGASSGGGIVMDSSHSIYHVTPYEYRISVFSSTGEFIEAFEKQPSYYRPLGGKNQNPQANPQGLGSFHSSWTHLWNIQLFEQSILMIFSGDRNGSETKYYMDLYDLGGAEIQTGIECKEDLALRAIGDDTLLYVLREKTIAKAGDLLNPSIVCYRLKRL